MSVNQLRQRHIQDRVREITALHEFSRKHRAVTLAEIEKIAVWLNDRERDLHLGSLEEAARALGFIKEGE
jgi:hypothetical protein